MNFKGQSERFSEFRNGFKGQRAESWTLGDGEAKAASGDAASCSDMERNSEP